MEKKAQELRVLDDLKSEEFVVDDLLDFSNGEFEDGVFENFEYEIEDKPCSVTIEKGEKTEEGFGSLINSDLCIPVDEVADLEWLSHFVEDSFSGYSIPLPVHRTEPVVPEAKAKPVMETPVQTKVRSKRGGTGFRVWSLTSPLLIESHSSSSSTSSSSGHTADTLLGQLPPTKRQRKRAGVVTSTASCGSHQARKCSHCGVQKTPQWRAGPTGPKTLCNACGVRYKSGRLLPEYRPACSPTFSSEVHSNNHRKVLEMRQQKEVGPLSGPQGQGF